MINLKFSSQDYLFFLSTSKEIVGINRKLDQTENINSLLFIDYQKNELIKNTTSFLNNQKFNNVFLWGEKGMGKSTLIRSVINFVQKKNKKKIIILEILSNDLIYLPEIIYKISSLKKKFIIFIDDINLTPEKPELSIFKVMIEGSILSKNKNIAFYVTSNLRNLITSALTKDLNDIEIKDRNASLFSLVERFGLKLGFHKCQKEEYLEIVKYYLKEYNLKCSKSIIENALSWSIKKGGFSGRIAEQFAKNQIGDNYS